MTSPELECDGRSARDAVAKPNNRRNCRFFLIGWTPDLCACTSEEAQGPPAERLNYDEGFSYPDLCPALGFESWRSLLLRGASPTPSYTPWRQGEYETMMYQISYGPPGSRMVESTENVDLAADRYYALARENAPKIELYVEGMPLDPRKLLRASPDRKYLRSILFAPR